MLQRKQDMDNLRAQMDEFLEHRHRTPRRTLRGRHRSQPVRQDRTRPPHRLVAAVLTLETQQSLP